MLELDLMRMTLIVGVVIAALIYQKTRLLSGGLMTGAYLALLISKGDTGDILGWAVLTVITFLVIKLVTQLVALPKAWILSIAILTSAVLHSIAVLASGGKGGNDPIFLGALEVVLAGGMYLTPGLTAYDLARQGWLKTLGVLAMITGVTLGITLGVAGIGNLAGPSQPLTTPLSVFYTDLSFPVVMVICIATAEVMRLAFGLGSGGIIGAVFFVELLAGNFWSFFVIIALVAITVILTRYANKFLVMTPRQSFQFTFILGSLIAWIGLSVGSQLGIEAALDANMYALEPLLAVGLISTDVVRFGTGKTTLGKIFVLIAVVITNIVFLQGGILAVSVIGFEITLIIALYMVGLIKVIRGWDHARMVGEMYPLIPGSSIEPTTSDSGRERRRKLRLIKLQEKQNRLVEALEREQTSP
ncbi:hypothetical protein AINA4_09160 [Aurantimicrobium sp. INA4]|uniref:poly-gamma-glutamate biosynthesis protein PgsC/CapC n=1 Tax=Aurantimicrobium sp. INA4 TaxID=2986279 RepID=UPI002492832F|nr:poly-gamma-glutamate biosynthesis protein PgsC/CapC [Aurantimicrobium sp. INA4]BDU10995.1 hypothetical protein AINA4_09160 [Aurantimicrobium sp. INA4]